MEKKEKNAFSYHKLEPTIEFDVILIYFLLTESNVKNMGKNFWSEVLINVMWVKGCDEVTTVYNLATNRNMNKLLSVSKIWYSLNFGSSNFKSSDLVHEIS